MTNQVTETTSSSPTSHAGGWRAWGDQRFWRRLGYLAATFATGWLWLCALILLLSLGVSMTIIWVGIPILWFTFHLVRWGAVFERLLVRGALGFEIAEPYRPDVAESKVELWKGRLADPATWRDLVYLMVALPILGTVWLVVLAITLPITAILISLPVTYSWFPDGRFTPLDFGREDWLIVDSVPDAILGLGVGLLLLAVVPAVVRAMASAHGSVARALLSPTRASRLGTQVAGLRRSRDSSLDAAEAERRRIERNLHDGAQQRLVALAMDLGMAKEKLHDDPAAASALVDEAHFHAKQALVELRDLARGIHPTVLTDRGLDAALSALAAQAPFPVDVVYSLEERPPARVESTAYFVAAESLANAAKHSGATRASVVVRRSGNVVHIEVEDNGTGGANKKGSGLAGLADRVDAVEGVLEVTSPTGGPTRISARLTCE